MYMPAKTQRKSERRIEHLVAKSVLQDYDTSGFVLLQYSLLRHDRWGVVLPYDGRGGVHVQQYMFLRGLVSCILFSYSIYF